MLIHSCTIQQITETRNTDGGAVFNYTTIASNVACRVTTKKDFLGERYKEIINSYTHSVYFADDPGINTTLFRILWTPMGRPQTTFSVHHTVNPDDLGWFWRVYCTEHT